MNTFIDKTRVNKEISHLHYISQGADGKAHLEHIDRVLKAGCNWVQLRMKNTAFEEVLETAHKAKKLCDQFNAKLIINDNVSIVQEVDAAGVHLGQQDMSTAEARKILGESKVIGGTANTLEQCLDHLKNGVDYIGLGPLRFTSTKEKLSPILGIEGYSSVLQKYLKNQNTVPIIAIGGITKEDFEALKSCGIHGVAVSGLLTQSQNLEEPIHQVFRLWRKNKIF
ncbi:thiamine phosphate synthase [Leeuwenhoekiella sp. NPDC079379]|uniref:thiamine phosphate synthase n=1 Tax=Leeuwenhoekiella sp. NPDC079379 TaxID=3364122 RepID=UPI0037CB1027